MTRRLLAATAFAASVVVTAPAAQPGSAQCPILGCIVRGCYDVWGGRICF